MDKRETVVTVTNGAFNRLIVAAFGLVIILSIPLFILAYAFEGGFDRFEKKASYVFPGTDVTHAQSPEGAVAVSQIAYVPVYSHVYIREGLAYRLAATLSIRNIDMTHPLTVQSVRYYDTGGVLVHDYLKGPVTVAPLATTEFFVEEKHDEGGSGAKFLVEWTAQNPIHPPVIETIMIGVEGQQGISFARSATVIQDLPRNAGNDPGQSAAKPASGL